MSSGRSDPLARFELPEHHAPDPIASLRDDVVRSGRVVVVIDDDPTGTQTTADAVLITRWEPEDIAWMFEQSAEIKFVLTNSRAHPVDEATAINRLVGERIRRAAAARSIEFELVSRSDSTLRGHFPDEVHALAEGAGFDAYGIVLMPFFAEGGRLTIHGTHYVLDDGALVPVGETPFARDATFGFHASDLRRWVEEKTQGRVRADDVALIDIDLIRTGGPAAVEARFRTLRPPAICVCDAVDDLDVRIVAAGLRRASIAGSRWILRSAASLVPALVGREPAQVVDPAPHPDGTPNGARGGAGGLVVVGSHVPLSTQQLEVLLSEPEVIGDEVAVDRLISSETRAAEIARVGEQAIRTIERGRTTVIYTSRTLVTSDDPLRAGERIASGLCEIVSMITASTRPAYVVAKGGITSHRIATDALHARRTRVLGPIAPGVPMWAMGPDTRLPGLRFVVFPGNVGDARTLADVVRRSEGAR